MFATASVMIALGAAAILALALLVDGVVAIWRHSIVRALFSFGLLLAIGGITSVLVAQADWANYGLYGVDPTWGALDERFYLAPFICAAVLLIVAALWHLRGRTSRSAASQQETESVWQAAEQ